MSITHSGKTYTALAKLHGTDRPYGFSIVPAFNGLSSRESRPSYPLNNLTFDDRIIFMIVPEKFDPISVEPTIYIGLKEINIVTPIQRRVQ